jgi:hypothetical protein
MGFIMQAATCGSMYHHKCTSIVHAAVSGTLMEYLDTWQGAAEAYLRANVAQFVSCNVSQHVEQDQLMCSLGEVLTFAVSFTFCGKHLDKYILYKLVRNDV